MIDWNKPIEYDTYNHGWVPARVVCRDRKDSFYNNIICYMIEGTEGVSFEPDNTPRVRNIKTKKEGWINIYKADDYYLQSIYKTKEEAFKQRAVSLYLDTIRIEWEE